MIYSLHVKIELVFLMVNIKRLKSTTDRELYRYD